MKKTLLLLLLCLGTQTRAQDVIITKEGDPVKAYRVEVAAETVFYQTAESYDAPIQHSAQFACHLRSEPCAGFGADRESFSYLNIILP